MLKLNSSITKGGDNPLDELLRSTKIYENISSVGSNGLIRAVSLAFPALTKVAFEKKKLDPTFLYDSVKICEDCHLIVKGITMAFKKKVHIAPTKQKLLPPVFP